MEPLRFVRALYCVDSRFRELRGAAAAARGCPTNGSGSAHFRAGNPALFRATGWSLHPYHLDAAPNVASPSADGDWVTLADLPRLEGSLDRIQRVYGSHKRFPIYLTEYGFDTNPPQLVNSVSPAKQATYLNEAEYMAWRDPRVQTLSQYLLKDDRLVDGARYSAFASGLEFINGTAKPSFAAYRLPIWMPSVRVKRGHSLEVWGCVRPAKRYPSGAIGPVLILLNGHAVRSVKITNPAGYFDVRVTFPRSGTVQLAWTYPQGPTVYSRSVKITQLSR